MQTDTSNHHPNCLCLDCEQARANYPGVPLGPAAILNLRTGEVGDAFNDDMIRRSGLPRDVMGLIHDLCYHVPSRGVEGYVKRAQRILSVDGCGKPGSESPPKPSVSQQVEAGEQEEKLRFREPGGELAAAHVRQKTREALFNEITEEWSWKSYPANEPLWSWIRRRNGEFIQQLPTALAEDICRKQSTAIVRAVDIAMKRLLSEQRDNSPATGVSPKESSSVSDISQTSPASEGRCDTTLTERFDIGGCGCATYEGNVGGPCKTFERGVNGRCVYCDHEKSCHDKLLALASPASEEKEEKQ